MSAYIVSDFHINALVSFGSHHGASWLTWDGKRKQMKGGEQEAAAHLYTTNVESVNRRYRESTPTTGFVYVSLDTYDAELPDPLDVLGACNCYDYQACEIDGYEFTPAFRIIHAIRDAAIRKLPGYDNAAWDLNPPQQENRT